MMKWLNAILTQKKLLLCTDNLESRREEDFTAIPAKKRGKASLFLCCAKATLLLAPKGGEPRSPPLEYPIAICSAGIAEDFNRSPDWFITHFSRHHLVALLHHSSLRGRFLAEAIQNAVKNHDIASILDCFVAQNAPRNDDSVQKIIYATTLGQFKFLMTNIVL